MSATTWGYPLRHPWYTMPTPLKRKHSSSSSDDEPVYPSSPLSPPAHSSAHKRRRCSILERGFAHLSLNSAIAHHAPSPALAYSLAQAPIVEVPSSPIVWPTASSDFDANMSDTIHVQELPIANPPADVLHGSVEEATPIVPEIKMKGTSWYEPEKDRIVITDLDAYSDISASEDEYTHETDPHPDASEHADSNANLTVSSVLLEHIKKASNFPYVPPTPGPARSQALVLFKPLPVPKEVKEAAEEKWESSKRKEDIQASAPSTISVDEDAMEIEP